MRKQPPEASPPCPHSPCSKMDPKSPKKAAKKACWDVNTARIFCELVAQEAADGNRPTKSLSSTGYNNLIAEFHKKIGRLYTAKQMKNRWDEMKSIWTAWVFYMQKATGLGWDPVKKTVTPSDEEWAGWIKVHKDIRRFRRGPPENLVLLERMFQRASVSGNSSVMPGVEGEEDVATQGQEDNDVVNLDEDTPQPSPVPTPVPKKRGASTIACSPKRQKKDPYGKDFRRFVDHCISEDQSEASSKMAAANDEAIMTEVIKCGAPETSDEYYIATKLFHKPDNRSFFYAMKTSEGRLTWLRRQFEDRNRR